MPDPSDPNPAYGYEEMQDILRRASKLQHAADTAEPEEHGLTLEELQIAAAAGGIDPQYVAQAAATLHMKPVQPGLLGPSGRYDASFKLKGEVSPEEFPRLRALIRQAMGEEDDDTPRSSGTYAPKSFEWNHGPLEQIKVVPGGGETEILARGRWGTMVAAQYGGLLIASGVFGAVLILLTGVEIGRAHV